MGKCFLGDELNFKIRIENYININGLPYTKIYLHFTTILQANK